MLVETMAKLHAPASSYAARCAALIAVALLTAALVLVNLAARMAAPRAMKTAATAVPIAGRSNDESRCLRVLEQRAALLGFVLVLLCCTATKLKVK